MDPGLLLIHTKPEGRRCRPIPCIFQTKEIFMPLYIATYWTGTAWVDLHADALPFKDAQQKLHSAAWTHQSVRLRPAPAATEFPAAAPVQ